MAGTAQAALAFIEQALPDALLLDIELPDGSGFDVLRRVRAADRTLPVIVVTANASIGKARLTVTPTNALEARRVVRELEAVRAEVAPDRDHGLAGASPALRALAASAGRHARHTRAEIAEQPQALAATDAALAPQPAPTAPCGFDRLTLLACRSSRSSSAVARDAFERASGTTLDIEIVSELRDRAAAPCGGALLVSQSGETADTLAAMRRFTSRGLPTLAAVNVVDPAICRAASQAWPVSAGPEIGVAATKSFTAQPLALLRLGIALGEARQTGDAAFRAALADELDSTGEICAAAEVPRRLVAEGEAMFSGRGWGAAMAAEAVLKP